MVGERRAKGVVPRIPLHPADYQSAISPVARRPAFGPAPPTHALALYTQSRQGVTFSAFGPPIRCRVYVCDFIITHLAALLPVGSRHAVLCTVLPDVLYSAASFTHWVVIALTLTSPHECRSLRHHSTHPATWGSRPSLRRARPPTPESTNRQPGIRQRLRG